MSKARTVIVVGAGVVGVTTAEALLQRGFHVTVIDAGSKAAEGTSKANAAQLCAPFATALGSPGFLRALPRNLLDPESGVSLSGLSLLLHWNWILRFITECSSTRSAANSSALLGLAYQSAAALDRVLTRQSLEFCRRVSGKLWIAPNKARLKDAEGGLKLKRAAGFDVTALDRSECLAIEPSLADSSYDFAGGIYAPESAVGDCRAFTLGLVKNLEADGVTFHFSTKVNSLVFSRERVVGVRCGARLFEADVVVLANGAEAMPLLPNFSGRVPLASLRGYSVTLPLAAGAPEVSLTDSKRAVAFCRLGDRLRVTGGAEFAGLREPSSKAIGRIISVARNWTPNAADFDSGQRFDWCGIRASTPSSLPVVSQAGRAGLYVNIGHGSLGWTLAAGTAERLVSLLSVAEG